MLAERKIGKQKEGTVMSADLGDVHSRSEDKIPILIQKHFNAPRISQQLINNYGKLVFS